MDYVESSFLFHRRHHHCETIATGGQPAHPYCSLGYLYIYTILLCVVLLAPPFLIERYSE
jgi:hypothetical protein